MIHVKFPRRQTFAVVDGKLKVTTPRKYYVYTHSFGSKVFYVGMGVLTRISFFGNSDRISEEWHKIIRKYGYCEVDVIAEYDNREEALKKESRLIKKYKPIGNIAGCK